MSTQNTTENVSCSSTSTPVYLVHVVMLWMLIYLKERQIFHWTNLLIGWIKQKNILDVLFAKALYATGVSFSLPGHPFWGDFFKRLRPAWSPPLRYELSGPLLNIWDVNLTKENNELIKGTVTYNFSCQRKQGPCSESLFI